MTYVKLPKTVQDHAIGFQSINQARDNCDALKSLYDAGHSVGAAGGSAIIGTAAILLAVGRHDDPCISRTVLRFRVDATLPVPIAIPIVSGPLMGGPPIRLSAGQWKLQLQRQSLLGAKADCESTKPEDMKATCFYANGIDTGASLIITTWMVDTGAWVPSDVGFSVALWLHSTN